MSKPDDPALPYENFVTVDEVTYSDDWGQWTDGGGSSLELTDPRADNRLAMNWAGSDETAKSSWTTIEQTGPLDWGNTNYPPIEYHVILMGAGKCLVDNLDVHINSQANLLPNGTFESGITGWLAMGNHRRSAWWQGEGDASAASLHVEASGDGDTGANHIEGDFNGLTSSATNVTIKARCRWLAGCPYIVFRLLGNWLDAAGTMDVPRNLGTPGLRNSSYVANAGPAIAEMTHFPVFPGAGSNVLVTARVHDPDGIAAVTLRYRLDPATGLTEVAMNDSGLSGDAVAGDGVYAGLIPGQSTDALVAFRVVATDSASPAAASESPPAGHAREGLVMFGQTVPAGTFGTFRIWVTQAVRTLWAGLPALSNDPMDVALVYNDFRVIYEASARYRGSPWLRRGGDPVNIVDAMALAVPKSDAVLGHTGFNMDDPVMYEPPWTRDETGQRERMSFWLADRLNIPTIYPRYINFFVNQVRKGVIFSDNDNPSGPYIDSWLPDHNEGELSEVSLWYEFDDNFGWQYGFKTVNATLENFTTAGGEKKTARYRWNWDKKGASVYGDENTNLFRLVDAINLTPGALLDRRMSDQIDYEEWMRVFATRRIVCDWDGYGYVGGKNAYVYKPVDDKWVMFLWDLDFSLGAWSDPVDQELFSMNDPVLRDNFFSRPVFRRAYWRAMQDAVDGPLKPGVCGPVMDDNYNALLANGISVADAAAVKTWIANRVNYIASQLAPVTNLAFSVTTGSFGTSSNPAVIAGRAPVRVKTILVNSNAYATAWTSDTDWTIEVPLQAGANLLNVTAWTASGAPAGSGQLTVTLSVAPAVPTNELVINEIMYHAAAPLADFVEILNVSASRTFDISGFRLDGADFVFPPGTFIKPGQFLVVAENLAGYVVAYQNSEVVAGEYSGSL
ncbi:MAG: hypothetical protein E4H28_06560, partial [Gemmatimonadales bacterium]